METRTDVPEPAAAAEKPLGDVRMQRAGTMGIATWGALGAFVLSLLGFVAAALLGVRGFVAAPLGWAIVLTPVLALVTSLFGAVNLRAGEALSVAGAELSIRRKRGEKRLPLADLREGWSSPAEKRVYLQTRRGDILSAAVPDEAAGQRLLEQAGLDASKRTWRTRLGPVDFLTAMSWLLGPIVALPLAEAIAGALRMGGALGVPLFLLIFAMEFYLVRGLFGPAHLVIGADGIIVEQRLRRRFVSFEDLDSISTGPSAVVLHLKDGTTVRARARNLDSAARSAIEQRVRAALALRGDRNVDPGALAELDRGSRTAAAWREALSGLLSQDRGYRRARLTREQVLGVLENPAAPAGRRVAAAYALATSGDGDAPTRIRIAAGASANEAVRSALEKIAEGEFEAEAIDLAAREEAGRAMPVAARPEDP